MMSGNAALAGSSPRPGAEQENKAQATVSPPNAEAEDLVFRLATDVLPTGGVQLSNGIVVLASDWQTLIVAKIPTGDNERVGTCTATLVGPNVVLMAAHCVDDMWGRPRRPKLEVDGRSLSLLCEMPPQYSVRPAQFGVPRGSEDYALCLLDDNGVTPGSLSSLRFEVVDGTTTLRFEVVDGTTTLNSADAVLMTGYGCHDLKVDDRGSLVRGKPDGKLRIGDEFIDGASTGMEPFPTYVTVRSSLGKEPTLCPGDSGGPLFSGASTDKPDVVRRVRGVNSMIRTDRRADGKYDIISSVAATGTSIFKTWADSWIASHEAKNPENPAKHPVVCGLNRKPGEMPCRD